MRTHGGREGFAAQFVGQPLNLRSMMIMICIGVGPDDANLKPHRRSLLRGLSVALPGDYRSGRRSENLPSFISNVTYFGEPIYTYSLKQGIADGFRAPYKVVRVTMDKDDGWHPDEGMTDRYGSEIPDQVYELPDFDRLIVLSERTKTVAARLIQFLANTNPMSKTIIFCEDNEHAEHVRSALVNAAATNDITSPAATDERYVTRITGDNPG